MKVTRYVSSWKPNEKILSYETRALKSSKVWFTSIALKGIQASITAYKVILKDNNFTNL